MQAAQEAWNSLVSKKQMVIELWISSVDQGWAHSVCSQADLAKALADVEVTAIESDIIMSPSLGIPIMAHPPAIESDLTFSEFLQRGVASGKHLKLDFKQPDVVQDCLKMCQQYSDRFQGIWLNADILPGPGKEGMQPIFEADSFVKMCLDALPGACLSLGWCVDLGLAGPYEDYHVDEMFDVLSRNSLLEARLVIPVNLRLAIMNSESRPPLLRLLENTACELLLWTGFGEPPISYQDIQYARHMYYAVEPDDIEDDPDAPAQRSCYRDRVAFDVIVAQKW
eukprot:CAMPEP_0197321676 /NCGR_PEP_ID=MMETSP0891-20130614/65849_1 /TAXON_ID=44058 ORGANISM="Aureoumbra lagunensis, Strain CCMP1510" /NCGR_SAMPLE_ID=MMETSP0891 /ASSEMBLY_ACC=CAM_ASM_000534 /LENGTH=281 /DNA_ID=CAMNT_0042813665 /DNA_START=1 /DNA_END=843 /DNA_ORIENTATION=+